MATSLGVFPLLFGELGSQDATTALEGSRIFALEQKWKSMNHENLKAFKNS